MKRATLIIRHWLWLVAVVAFVCVFFVETDLNAATGIAEDNFSSSVYSADPSNQQFDIGSKSNTWFYILEILVVFVFLGLGLYFARVKDPQGETKYLVTIGTKFVGVYGSAFCFLLCLSFFVLHKINVTTEHIRDVALINENLSNFVVSFEDYSIKKEISLGQALVAAPTKNLATIEKIAADYYYYQQQLSQLISEKLHELESGLHSKKRGNAQLERSYQFLVALKSKNEEADKQTQQLISLLKAKRYTAASKLN
ncbi:hypothetical protein B6D60_10135, partial [candidate division KSB1 bacterium 4484_87]